MKTLEPYEGKLSSTVLGGERRSNPPDNPRTRLDSENNFIISNVIEDITVKINEINISYLKSRHVFIYLDSYHQSAVHRAGKCEWNPVEEVAQNSKFGFQFSEISDVRD